MAGCDLTSLPGVGVDTAAVILSELGCDLSRFPTERHFASYLGLAPSLGKSAGKDVRQSRRHRNTSKAGRALRMAAASLYRSKSWLGAFFRKVARSCDKKAAVKATARKLAHLVYRMMRYGKAYVEKGAAAFEADAREKRLKSVRSAVKSLNITAEELAGVLAIPA
jgi:transposase